MSNPLVIGVDPVRCEKSIRGFRELRGGPIVVVQHAAQDVSPLDGTIPRNASSRQWAPLVDALMGPSMVVVVHIGRQYPVQMVLVDDE